MRSTLIATGSYLPEKIMTNADLEKLVDTSDEWIVQRSGIKSRHIAADGQTTGDMAIAAGRKALEALGLAPDQIDLIVVATTTPDNTFPAVAAKVQAALGIPAGIAFDVQAVCTGFVYALTVADSFIRTGQAKHALVIGADKMSAIVDWNDRTTCVLFADGAGAVVLKAEQGEPGNVKEAGIHANRLYANGAQSDLLYVNGGPSSTGSTGHIVMEGREVFKYAVSYMAGAVTDVMEKAGVAPADIDWLIPHQANLRIIEATAKKLDMG
ncbi:MAG TPA: beta-ketoacyl-ACP synthase III, partial [Alphaproteobacteria bacterium]|nr:beta-ketoacyl-ACP synthase III [Alphaproteobacteria bacterium]